MILGCILWSTHAAWNTSGRQLAISLGCGLLLGVGVAKLRGRLRLVSDVLAAGLASLVAWGQVAITLMHHRTVDLAYSISAWSGLIVTRIVEVNLPWFFFAILMLASGLGYMSVWCVRWPRWLWPMHGAHTLILLYFLYPHWDQNIPVCLVFILASLLLSLHVHLGLSVENWTRAGTPYPAHLKKVMTRLGALTAIVILLLAWFLPAGYVNPAAANLWNRAQASLRALIAGQYGPLSAAYPFSSSLSLTGTPRLSSQVVATVQSPAQNVYLQARWYDTYNGEDWTNGDTIMMDFSPGESLPSRTLMTYPLRQNITLMSPGQEDYLLGAPGISAISLPATLMTYVWNDEPVAWFAQQGAAAVTQYQVISSVSDADAQTLRTVVQAADQGHYLTEYDQLYPFLLLPPDLDPRIAHLAEQITTGIPDMYDKAVALETYLRTHYTYNLNIQLPSGREAVSWFLFDSGNQGYCTFFASAMAILARSLGIPARVISGYAPGSYDSSSGLQIIRGTDAHSWTQIYFNGFGWINFEPTSSFPTFNHSLPTLASPSSPQMRAVSPASGNAVLAAFRGTLTTLLSALIPFALLLSLLCLLAIQRLQPRTRAAELYRSVCVLARWAGCRPSSSQTPREFIQRLLLVLPQAKGPLERLCDLYVRERWAHPASAEHPRSTGELQEVADLWVELRPRLVRAILRRGVRRLLFKKSV